CERREQDHSRKPPTETILGERRETEDRCAERQGDDRRAVLVVMRVLPWIVREEEVTERNDRRDERPLRSHREEETRCEERENENDLQSDLALHEDAEHAQRVEQQGVRDFELVRSKARVAAEVLPGRAARERGDDHLEGQ